MERRQGLGIALGEGELSAVVLELTGRRPVATATARLPLEPGRHGADALGAALERLVAALPRRGRGCACVLGLPLALLIVHNLRLPFQDTKQQALALPSALEELLLRPGSAERAIGAFNLIDTDPAGARLLAYAADKTLLQALLPPARKACDPDCLCPTLPLLASQIGAAEPDALVLHLAAETAELAFVHNSRMACCRALSVPAGTAAAACVPALTLAIRQSLSLFRQQAAPDAGAPAGLWLCGPLAGDAELPGQLERALQIPVQRWQAELTGRALAPDFDAALACALAALQQKSPASLNFRRGELAPKSGFWPGLRGKKGRIPAVLALAACLACLLLAGRVQSLKAQSARLHDEMEGIYRSAFPTVQVVHDPYMEMQAALRAGGPAASPLFAPGRPAALTVLAELSKRLPEDLKLTVQRFTLDPDRALLRGQTKSFGDVERIRALLAASPLFHEVRILSSTMDKSSADSPVRFELSLKRTGGAP